MRRVNRSIIVRATGRRARCASYSTSTHGTSSPSEGQGTGATSRIEKKTTKMWGGRFSKDIDESIKGWTESITVDSHIVAEDIWGSLAHVAMLGNQGIVPPEKTGLILNKLLEFQDSWLDKSFKWLPEQEDVHMNVEKKLIDALGLDVGGRMHTCRSRNDQVVLDSKLYARKRLLELRGRVADSVEAFFKKAEPHTSDVMVAYTHVQHAQPVSIAYWLSHYALILLRDLDRLKAAYDLTDQNPLGTGAIAGTSFPIDRTITSDLLGFQSIHENGLDATSSRDFMLEIISANAIIQTTLSRLAEEFIYWSSWEFRSLTLDDGFAMGSSMMPQKKNPGALELLRGRAGRVNGLMVAGFTMMKGLPSGYNRDFHEDKEILVESLSLVNRAVEVIPALIQSTKINTDRMKELSYGNFANATELANYLVSKKDVAFREAHDIVGSLVGNLSRAGKNFSETQQCYEWLKKHGVEVEMKEVQRILDPASVMLSYESRGGTGKKEVERLIKEGQQQLAEKRKELEADKKRVTDAWNAARAIAKEAKGIKDADALKKLVAKHRPQSLSKELRRS